MKLCTFSVDSPLGEQRRVGVVSDATIIDATAARIGFLERSLSRAAAQRIGEAQVPADMVALIGTGKPVLDWLKEAVEQVAALGQERTSGGVTVIYPRDAVRLLAPIPRPPGIACFTTWPAHIDDTRDKGYTMLKFPDPKGDLRAYYKGNADAVEGPDTVIPRPGYAAETDMECEMAAVIGTGGKDLSHEQARDAIFGYTIFNDVSYREIQLREMAYGLGPTKGKDADHSNVLGPWLVTADEIGDPQDLTMSFIVNGRTISSYHTSKMVWGFADLAAYLAKGQTLHAGHVITSGSFPGGSALDSNLRLHSGDRVELHIERIGTLASTVA